MEQALTQLDVKILFDDFTYYANIDEIKTFLGISYVNTMSLPIYYIR